MCYYHVVLSSDTDRQLEMMIVKVFYTLKITASRH